MSAREKLMQIVEDFVGSLPEDDSPQGLKKALRARFREINCILMAMFLMGIWGLVLPSAGLGRWRAAFAVCCLGFAYGGGFLLFSYEWDVLALPVIACCAWAAFSMLLALSEGLKAWEEWE